MLYDKDDITELIAANQVHVHPLVLLSVVDHFTRINSRTATPRRVMGLLLGSFVKKDGLITLDINNCFAVPFDEDTANPDVWFLDTNYAEDMFIMYKKVLPRVQVVGWYSSGPTIASNDLLLHTVVADRFCPNPVYCVVNTDTKKNGVPVVAYTAVQSRTANHLEFRNIPTQLGATEPEEIGVEQLLRDLTDSTVTTLSTKIGDRQLALAQLETLLGAIEEYLRDAARGALPVSQEILSVAQELLGHMPLIHRLKTSDSMTTTLNDDAIATFIAAASRCVMALYGVVRNRRHVAREIEELRKKKIAEREKEKADKEKEKAEKQKTEEQKKSEGQSASEKKN